MAEMTPQVEDLLRILRTYPWKTVRRVLDGTSNDGIAEQLVALQDAIIMARVHGLDEAKVKGHSTFTVVMNYQFTLQVEAASKDEVDELLGATNGDDPEINWCHNGRSFCASGNFQDQRIYKEN
jgi:hypothetical protein